MSHTRPAARPSLPPLSGYSFNLYIEARIAQGLILVERQPDVVDGFAIQLGPKQVTISHLPFFIVPTDCQIKRMRCQIRVGLPQRIMAIAGPAVVGWVVDHGGANGIEFDVALASKQVGSAWISEDL